MILLEIIFPAEKKRLFLTTDESMTIRDFKKNLSRKLSINNKRIHLIRATKNVSDDMTIGESGMYNGSGVVIEDG